MKKLDTLVTDRLIERLFQSHHLTAHLASVMAKRAESAAEVDRRITRLQTKVCDERREVRPRPSSNDQESSCH
jgi:hypothetical protein